MARESDLILQPHLLTVRASTRRVYAAQAARIAI